ncbi:membrane protein containing Sporulation/cell division region, bacteria domain protein [Candidatus Magnetobacterium bavaricum]|uniref:Membrane protein containing Sporulation/cell division region, bacteria domain protein n=1 Tax=Candidatus Magnetobacterium bavaricum TaxID=29290 RepID=A0A0F3GQ98_9BACT|nr:membrane protein containing Sporulation/cell division region, bacteria domain protein [Candidatus Magnetobacterium bavaricum]
MYRVTKVINVFVAVVIVCSMLLGGYKEASAADGDDGSNSTSRSFLTGAGVVLGVAFLAFIVKEIITGNNPDEQQRTDSNATKTDSNAKKDVEIKLVSTFNPGTAAVDNRQNNVVPSLSQSGNTDTSVNGEKSNVKSTNADMAMNGYLNGAGKNYSKATRQDEDGYALQIGAFKNPTNADGLAKTFEESGYKVFTKMFLTENTPLKKVYIWGFVNKEEALMAKKKIKKQRNIDAILILPTQGS